MNLRFSYIVAYLYKVYIKMYIAIKEHVSKAHLPNLPKQTLLTLSRRYSMFTQYIIIIRNNS